MDCIYSESCNKSSSDTMSARDRTERLPLQMPSSAMHRFSRSALEESRLLALQLNKRALGKVVIVQFSFHDVVY